MALPRAGNRDLPTALDAALLERRVVFSASPIDIDGHELFEAAEIELPFAAIDEFRLDSVRIDQASHFDEFFAVETAAEIASSALPSTTLDTALPKTSSLEILFVDGGVEDTESLVADFLERAGPDRNTEVILLDTARDGIEQISEILADKANVDAVHLVSHGTGGQLKLGNSWLTIDTLHRASDEISGWNASLRENADLLIYGCDLAATDDGRALAYALGELCECDVAASADVTGHDTRGGNWELEFSSGHVETQIAFSAAAQQAWYGSLGAITVTTTTDQLDGDADTSSLAALALVPGSDGFVSLREAIKASNTDIGADTIFLPAGAYEIAINGTDPNEGDYDLYDDLSLVGISPDATVIDALNVTTLFDVHDDSPITVSFSNLRLQNGRSTIFGEETGAALKIDGTTNTTSVFVHNVWFSGNNSTFIAGKGGAIYNAGNLTVSQALFEGNASNEGGAIYNSATGNLTMTNVTIGDNSAVGNGGGLVNEDGGSATVRYSTIANNTAAGFGTNSGGGILSLGLSGLDIANSVIAGNSADVGNDISGTIDSSGNNLIGDDSSANGLVGSDHRNVDPQLAALLDNGGSLMTYEPAAPEVIDGANTTIPASVDGRGFLRNDGVADIGAHEVGASALPIPGRLWLSTANSVVSGGQAGDDSWAPSDLIEVGNPLLNLGSGATSGTFTTTFAGDPFAPGWNLNAAHYVSSDIQIGDGNFQLKGGDLLLSPNGSPLFTSNNVTPLAAGFQATLNADRKDLVVFRPDTVGDYSKGQFGMLLQDVSGGGEVRGVTLIEQTTVVGGYSLQAGDFLYSRSGPGDDHSVWLYETGTTGVGATPLDRIEFLDGDAAGVGIQEKIFGMELIEVATQIGGEMLAGGTLLLNVDSAAQVGSNDLDVDEFDIFSLNVATSSLVGPGAAVASLLFDGSDVAFDSSAEALDALIAIAASDSPVADAGGIYVINEGDNLVLDGSGSSDDGTIVEYKWDFNNDSDYDDFTSVNAASTIDWATIASWGLDDGNVGGTDYTIGLQVVDDSGATNETTTTVTINNVAPTLLTTGTGSAIAGTPYTLNLVANDPGNETITGWTINWGDGTIDMINGNPSSATHTYANSGMTNNVLVSATDEDGTHLQNELLVASSGNDRVLRYGPDGSFLQAFATADGTDYPVDTVIGPDGNLYLSGWNSDNVLRYNATTGLFIDEFVPAGTGGLDSAAGLAFGADGNLYVASRLTGEVLRFDGSNGAFIDAFVAAGSSGLSEPEGLTFGPNGDLYVSDYSNSAVYKYDGETGVFDSVFVASGSGGLDLGEDLVFGSDGHLYVASDNGSNVLRYDGATGGFINAFVPSGSNGLSAATGVTFGPDGNLYVGSWGTDEVLRFDGTSGAFIDSFIAAGSGGLNEPDYFTFVPEHQVTVSPSDVLLAYEPFAYVAGTLDGTNGGSGWSTAWTTNNPSTAIVSVTGLNDATGTLVTEGGSAEMNTTSQFSQSRELDAAIGTDDTTIWLSFLLEVDTLSGGISLELGDFGGADDTVTIGTSSNDFLMTRNRSIVGASTINNVLMDGQTYYVAAQLDFAAGNDTITMYIDPTPGLASPDSPGSLTAQLTNADLGMFTRIGLVGGFTGNNSSIDEIRIGETYLAVSPVSSNVNSPVADDESFSVIEGGTATEADLDAGVNLLDGDTDLDLPNDTLTVNPTPVVDVSHGTLTLNANGTFSYVHDGGEDLTDIFTYEVRDAVGHTDTATVTISITPDNDNNPVADDESFSVIEGGTATEADLDAGVNLLDGDTDLDLPNDALTVNTTPIVDVSHGTLTLNANGTFSYVHDGGEDLTDTFTYEVRDAVGHTDTATVTISITPDNDNNPVADDESFSVIEGGTATEADLDAGVNLLDGDTDLDLPNDTLTVNPTPVVDVSHGTLTLNANGTFSYVHDGSENFTDSFVYQVRDAVGNAGTATVAILINPDNDNNPVADDESFSVGFASTATEGDLDSGTSLLDGDTDIDLPNDALTINTAPIIDPSFGTLTLNANGTFRYIHDGSLNFADSFTYEVVDAVGNSSTANVAITIDRGSSPIADDETFTVAEGGTATELMLDVGVSLLDGDTDPDLPGDLLTVDVTPVSGPNFGSLTLTSSGSFSYTHDGSENFTDSFVYRVRDSAGNSDTAIVNVTVTPVNDNSPIADADSFRVLEGSTATQADLVAGISLLDGDSDLDLPHDNLTVSTTPISGPSHGQLTLHVNGTFSYTHDGSENFTDVFTYEVIDAAGNSAIATVSVIVTPVNEPPTDISPNNVDLADGTDTTGGYSVAHLNTTDPDDVDSHNYSIQPGADGLLFSIGGANDDELILNDGVLSAATKETYAVNLRVTDAGGSTHDETFTVNVTSVNASPTDIFPNAFAVNENVDTTGGVTIGTLSASDPNIGETFTYSIQTGGDGNLFTLGGNGNDQLTLDAGVLNFESKSHYTVNIRVTDSGQGVYDETLIVAVNDLNESPIATNDKYAVAGDSVLVVAPGVLANDVDPEGALVTVSIVTHPGYGTLSLNADGSFTYRPDAGYFGTDRFVYQIDDGFNEPEQATVQLVVPLLAVPPQSPGFEATTNERQAEVEEGDSTVESPAIGADGGSIPMMQATNPLRRSSGGSTDPTVESTSDGENEIATPEASAPVTKVSAEPFVQRGRSTRDSSAREGTQNIASSFQPLPDVPRALLQGFDDLRDDVDSNRFLSQAIVGSSLAVTSSLSVGYVIWLIRGGVILSSVLSSLPAWQFVDPLPVLGFMDDDDDEVQDDESLESLVANSNQGSEVQ